MATSSSPNVPFTVFPELPLRLFRRSPGGDLACGSKPRCAVISSCSPRLITRCISAEYNFSTSDGVLHSDVSASSIESFGLICLLFLFMEQP